MEGSVKKCEPAPPGRVEAMWERLGSAGSAESTGRLMLGIGVAAVLRMVNHDGTDRPLNGWLRLLVK